MHLYVDLLAKLMLFLLAYKTQISLGVVYRIFFLTQAKILTQ